MSEGLSPAVREVLEGLTEVQRAAATWDDGSLLLLAGPGSGKTRVLTSRIARLLDSTRDAKFRILALTFTNKAADEMRERVQLLVPGMEHRAFLGTFHSFCADVLRQHGSHVGVRPDFRIYSTREDQEAVLREALAGLRERAPEHAAAHPGLLPAIERLKKELVFPDDAAAHIPDERQRARGVAVYAAYEAALGAHNALDFNSLILHVYALFTRYPAFAKRYRAVYPYWCIDEFQDTTVAQYRVLSALAGGVLRNVFVVADDDQIIYQWNGASHRRIATFAEEFEPQTMQLPANFRCPPAVVAYANQLIGHNFLRAAGKEPLVAVRQADALDATCVEVQGFPDDASEYASVASHIASRPPAERAGTVVLARARQQLEAMQEQLRARAVPACVSQRRDRFMSAEFTWLHACLRQALDRGDARNLDLLVGALDRMADTVTPVDDIAARAEVGDGDLLRAWVAWASAGTGQTERARAAVELVRTYLVRSDDYRNFMRSAVRWLRESGNSGASASPFDSPYEEDWRAWHALTRDIASAIGTAAPLDAFLQELDLRSKEPPADPSAVVLMTIHSAKGKEFDHVYVVGLAEGVLPSYQSLQRGDGSPEMEEERRNCFVAITRTKRTLMLTHARRYRGYAKTPSRFLSEMGLAGA